MLHSNLSIGWGWAAGPFRDLPHNNPLVGRWGRHLARMARWGGRQRPPPGSKPLSGTVISGGGSGGSLRRGRSGWGNGSSRIPLLIIPYPGEADFQLPKALKRFSIQGLLLYLSIPLPVTIDGNSPCIITSYYAPICLGIAAVTDWYPYSPTGTLGGARRLRLRLRLRRKRRRLRRRGALLGGARRLRRRRWRWWGRSRAVSPHRPSH